MDAYGAHDILSSRLLAGGILARFRGRGSVAKTERDADMNLQANKALEPTADGAFIMTVTDNITAPASVTLRSAAVAQLDG